jgi:hypothetical protein
MQNISQSSTIEQIRQQLENIPDRNKVGCGWFRFTCSYSYLAYWRKRIEQYFRTRLRSRGKGWNGYLSSLRGNFSIIIGYSAPMTLEERTSLGIRRSPNEGYMTVDIPQTAMDSLSGLNLFKLLIDIYGCEGVTFNRVDIYYDDYCKIISPEAVHKACRRGGVGVPRYKRARNNSEDDLRRGRTESYTVYFGTLQSDKQIRYYDKFAESKGKQDCYRWEAELKRTYAEAFQKEFEGVLSQALDSPTLEGSLAVITNYYKSVVKGSIDFREIPMGKAPADLPANWAIRMPRVWWWEELLSGLEPAKLVVERVAPSLEGIKDWIKYQVAPSLSLMRAAYRYWNIPFHSWLQNCLEEGEDRWSSRHEQMFEEALLISPAT